MKTSSLLRAFLGAALFLMQCSCGDEVNEIYGTPYADFILTGNVVNSDGAPLVNVDVKNVMDTSCAGWSQIPRGEVGVLKGTTDETGRYLISCEFYNFIALAQDTIADNLHFRYEDPASLYEPFDTFIPLESLRLSGGDDNWYDGKAFVRIDVVLKDKQ